MNEIDDNYVFHPNGDCDCSHPNYEEIIHRRSFFDIDTSGSQFLNHLDFIVDDKNSSNLNLPPEQFNFPPGYRRVVHAVESVVNNSNILGTGSAIPEVFAKKNVQKRIVHKVGDLFHSTFIENVEVRESTIPNVSKLQKYSLLIYLYNYIIITFYNIVF